VNETLGWKDSDAKLCEPHQIRQEAWNKERADLIAMMEDEKTELRDRIGTLEDALQERDAFNQRETERLRNGLAWFQENERLRTENERMVSAVEGVLRENERLQNMLQELAILSAKAQEHIKSPSAEESASVSPAVCPTTFGRGKPKPPFIPGTYSSGNASAGPADSEKQQKRRVAALGTTITKMDAVLKFVVRPPGMGQHHGANDDDGDNPESEEDHVASLVEKQQRRLLAKIKAAMPPSDDSNNPNVELDEKVRDAIFSPSARFCVTY
jgi:hypothetical protein